MSKGLLFWIIWMLCLIAYVGAQFWGWQSIYNGVIVLVLLGLLGWHNFGPPIQ